jgi:predicted dehydrogenase
MLKVGVIGVGGIAKTHMPGWAASPLAEVVAGCDIDLPVLQKWGEQHGVQSKRLHERWQDLVADPDIDVIDICVPNYLHAPMAIAALDAGKDVLCEKPLAPRPDEIREMILARDRSKRMLMTAQHFRFRGNSKAMKAELNTGIMGDIYHARSWMLRRYAVPARPWFKQKEFSGGGPTIDIGVHILDLTLWFLGHPKPISVSGVAPAKLAKQEGAFSMWGGKITGEFTVEDFAAALVRFDNGATLMLEVSWMLHHDIETTEDMQMWLYGTKAGCHWPKCEFYRSNNASNQIYNSTLKSTKDQLEAHAEECVEFAQAVVDGAPSPVPAEQSLAVMTILDGIYRSQKSGREVEL